MGGEAASDHSILYAGRVPVVAILGRPNVGKSTLFNALTRTRDALVADKPGVTRDRLYGRWSDPQFPMVLIDTGGLVPFGPDDLQQRMAHQVAEAVKVADLLLLVVDAQTGLSAADNEVAQRCRETGKLVVLLINKTDGLEPEAAAADFYALGFESSLAISASHRRGLEKIRELTHSLLLQAGFVWPAMASTTEEKKTDRIRLGIVGRPNVGKSTLVNRFLGEERQLVYDAPGTTLDSVAIPFESEWAGALHRFMLIDTAGIRRRARISEALEHSSVFKTLQTIEKSDVVVFLCDATNGITDQDKHILGYIVESGTALVIAVNKWEIANTEQREALELAWETGCDFVQFARLHRISALRGTGIWPVLKSVERAYWCARRTVQTAEVNRLLSEAQRVHQPPLVKGRRVKLRYAHIGGQQPPTIVVHGNSLDALPQHYARFLENFFMKALKIEGTPLRVQFKTGDNPYAHKRNPLTPRQRRKKSAKKRQMGK